MLWANHSFISKAESSPTCASLFETTPLVFTVGGKPDCMFQHIYWHADGATVVVTEGRGNIRNKPILAKGPALTKAPLTVLVNQQSASASEIFAGALQDNCRAILVGKR